MNAIIEIMDLLSIFLQTIYDLDNKFPIIRKEQSGAKPPYPYGAYKLLSESSKGFDTRYQKENDDPTKITDTYSRENISTVSLSFYTNENSQDAYKKLHTITEHAINYLGILCKDDIASLNVVLNLFNFTVQDRTTYIDPVYEYQLGFDFTIRERKAIDKVVDAIDMVATIAGVEANYE